MKCKTSKTKKGFPVYITSEPMNLTIYRERCRGDVRYAVTYYDSAGARQRRTFATFEEADAEATKLKDEIRQGGWDLITLRGSERLAYQRAMETLHPLGVPLDLAVLKLVDALKVLGSDQLIEAARFYRSHNVVATLPRKTVPEVFSELLANRKANGKSELYLKDLQLRIGRFAESFKGPISAVTTKDIDQFLLKLKVKGRTRFNFLRTIGLLFSYAQAQGYLPPDHPGISRVSKPSLPPPEVEVFTPEEMQKILDQAEPEAIPALVIGAFAGVRSEEIKRLDWSDVNLQEGHIEIRARNSKTRLRRLITMPENLRQWLRPLAKLNGPVLPFVTLNNQFQKLARKAKLPWKRNGLRHSFISYRVAETNDVSKVSYEAGNSPAMIQRHYLKVVTPKQAKAWFAIVPQDAGVIPMPAAA